MTPNDMNQIKKTRRRAQFVHQLDEQVVATRWWDEGFRVLKVGSS
jgi:hypothetical protein